MIQWLEGVSQQDLVIVRGKSTGCYQWLGKLTESYDCRGNDWNTVVFNFSCI